MSKGLGDSIAKVTHSLKIDRVAEAISLWLGAEGCGCDDRRELLNRLFPYGQKRQFRVKSSLGLNIGGKLYVNEIGEIITVSINDPIHQYVLDFVNKGILEEI